MSKQVKYKDVLNQIFMIWLICYGSIVVQAVSGYFLSYVFMPYVGFLLMAGIIVWGNYNDKTSQLNCSLLTHYTVYALGAAGVVMLVANLMNTHFITNKYSEFSHQDYPYHVTFIIYPIATVIYGISVLRRGKTEYCQACKAVAAFSLSETLRRNVLHHECRLQLKLAFGMSLFVSVESYVYYFVYYSSGSIGRLYTPDTFFIYVFPAMLFVISVIYFAVKYSGMQFEIVLAEQSQDQTLTTRLRYMIVHGDKLLLKQTVIAEFGTGFWDTPANRVIPYHETITIEKAENEFRLISGVHDFKIKKLFTSVTKLQSIEHYAVFLPEDKSELPMLGGTWFDLREIQMMLRSGMITRAFAEEIHRVYTITMAWKTYDKDGKRLYPIKNYHPTFRLRDFVNWDVDYDDLDWLNVSRNNEDQRFYHIRKFWRKYIMGTDPRWKRKRSS